MSIEFIAVTNAMAMAATIPIGSIPSSIPTSRDAPFSMHGMRKPSTYLDELWRYSRHNPRYRHVPAAEPFDRVKEGLGDFWAFAKSVGFPEVERDLVIAAIVAAIGL